jgi:hypothetical protein
MLNNQLFEGSDQSVFASPALFTWLTPVSPVLSSLYNSLNFYNKGVLREGIQRRAKECGGFFQGLSAQTKIPKSGT